MDIGDKVIIHHFINDDCENKDLKIGVVVGSKMSEDLSYHGSSHYEQIYTVKDDNGNIYEGTYRYDYIHFGCVDKTYFLTPEEQEKEWRKKIIGLEKEINEKYNKIQDFTNMIKTFCKIT